MKGTILLSKTLGAMVGSALGDAIGEMAFRVPMLEPLRALAGQAPLLRYTDDTAMAIGLAESLIERGCIDQQHIGDRFRDNFLREPWRGYASGPPTVFRLVEKKGIPYPKAARMLFRGAGSLGNGASMRIAPVGLFFHAAPDLYEKACASAEVTHAHPVGMDGAAVLACAVARTATLPPGETFQEVEFLDHLSAIARTPEIRSKMETLRTLLTEHAPAPIAADILGRSVAVHESMPFALYAFLLHAHSFQDCLFCAVLNGGDRDTLGAMAGALSGAYLGIEAVPPSWKERLESRSTIEQLARSLARGPRDAGGHL